MRRALVTSLPAGDGAPGDHCSNAVVRRTLTISLSDERMRATHNRLDRDRDVKGIGVNERRGVAGDRNMAFPEHEIATLQLGQRHRGAECALLHVAVARAGDPAAESGLVAFTSSLVVNDPNPPPSQLPPTSAARETDRVGWPSVPEISPTPIKRLTPEHFHVH